MSSNYGISYTAKFASMFGVISLLSASRYQSGYERFKGFNIPSRAFLYLLFAYAGIVSGARTGVMMGIVAVLAYFILRSRILTAASYLLGLISLVFVISVSSYVVESRILNHWTNSIEANMPAWMDLNVNLSTLTIRFIGFSQWTKPEFWMPFGHTFSDPDYAMTFPSRDMLTYFMLKFGYVPILIMLIVGGILMFKFHNSICRRGVYHSNLYLSMSIIVCILFGCLTTSNLSTYPINQILYLFIGFCIVSVRRSMQDRGEEFERSQLNDD